MSHAHTHAQHGVDANGCPVEIVEIDGQEVCVHYDDIPESDVTTVHGVRCTTPMRTVIDIAPELDADDLDRVVRHCLDRRLFTVADAMTRTSQPDMTSRPGALLLRAYLRR